jgi:chloramphenicol 3-O phosphotransferase
MPNGSVETGPAFAAREDAWREGLASMARAGAPLILDEIFLSGAMGQASMRRLPRGVRVVWVGVHCDSDVAADREMQRPDRMSGMARAQADAVHVGMVYDVEVDTTAMSPEACARVIAARIEV